MQDAVVKMFPAFTIKFEGNIKWPYLDVKGLVTVGWGFLIDPFTLAHSLPWVIGSTGEKPTMDQVWRDWKRVKQATNLAHQGAWAAQRYTTIRLTDDGMADTAAHRLRLNESYILQHWFPDFEQWPADAQAALMSMCWAMGADGFYHFPKFVAFARAQDWKGCALECFINARNNAGLVPRNWANRKLFTAATTTENPSLITGWP